jgi:hypothetical protein
VVRSPASLLCLLLALVSGSSLFCAPVLAEKNDHAFGDRELLSSFPSNPGFPEGVAVYKDKVSFFYFHLRRRSSTCTVGFVLTIVCNFFDTD